jgi:hypothetical protein
MGVELSVRSPMPLRALSRLAKSDDAFAISPRAKRAQKTRRCDALQRFGGRRAVTRAFDIGRSATGR